MTSSTAVHWSTATNYRLFVSVLIVLTSLVHFSYETNSPPMTHVPDIPQGVVAVSNASVSSSTLSPTPRRVHGDDEDGASVAVPADRDSKHSNQLDSKDAEQPTSKTISRIRAKRNWKTSRIQAAWGKRNVNDRVGRLRILDSRNRRKWSKVGRQAWGKRNVKPEVDTEEMSIDSQSPTFIDDDLDTLILSADHQRLANEEDAVSAPVQPVRERRKWGVGSARTAWGKRKWGANNDMRAWGKRKAYEVVYDDDDNDDDVKQQNVDQLETGNSLTTSKPRSKRNAIEGDDSAQWLIDDVSNPASSEHRRLIRAAFGAGVGAGRRYIGPKRNWQTNTMKVWGKRFDGNNLATLLDVYNDDEDNNNGGNPNVWNDSEGDSEQQMAAKKAWSGDNSLRVWGKRSHQVLARHDSYSPYDLLGIDEDQSYD